MRVQDIGLMENVVHVKVCNGIGTDGFQEHGISRARQRKGLTRLVKVEAETHRPKSVKRQPGYQCRMRIQSLSPGLLFWAPGRPKVRIELLDYYTMQPLLPASPLWGDGFIKIKSWRKLTRREIHLACFPIGYHFRMQLVSSLAINCFQQAETRQRFRFTVSQYYYMHIVRRWMFRLWNRPHLLTTATVLVRKGMIRREMSKKC